MRPDKIKETFSNREIAPSDDAWNRLSSRLDEKNKKLNRSYLYWISAVAAVIVVAFLLFPMLEHNSGTINDNPIVNEQHNETKNQIKQQSTQELVNTTVTPQKEIVEIVNEQKSIIPKTELVSNPTKEIKTTHKQEPVTNDMIQEKPIIPVVSNVIASHLVSSSVSDSISTSISDSVQPLTAAQEADLLLENAMKNIEPSDIVVQEIDVDRLLMETEWDIESDRRNRLQNSLEKGLEFLKNEAVTLVDKNN